MIDPSEAIRIELDLRDLRIEAEENATTDQYAELASGLPSAIRESLSCSPELDEFDVTPRVVSQLQGVPSKSWYQLLDGVMVLIAPLGVAGIIKQIVRIIEVTRPKFPAQFELKTKDGITVILRKGKLTDADIREVERTFREERQIVVKARRSKQKSR